MKVARSRLQAFRKGIPRIHTLRRAGVSSVRVARAAGTPMITYGTDTAGMAPTHLMSVRRALAQAVAPEAGGKGPPGPK